jgi:hypothetical protein
MATRGAGLRVASGDRWNREVYGDVTRNVTGAASTTERGGEIVGDKNSKRIEARDLTGIPTQRPVGRLTESADQLVLATCRYQPDQGLAHPAACTEYCHPRH